MESKIRYSIGLGLLGLVLCSGCYDEEKPLAAEPDPQAPPVLHESCAEHAIAYQEPTPKKGWPRFRGPLGTGVYDAKLELLDEPKKLWDADVGSGNASLIVHENRIYTVGRDRSPTKLICLDLRTGKTVYSKEIKSYHDNSSPTFDEGKLYLLAENDGIPYVLCCRADTGEEIWRTNLVKPTGTRHYGHTGSPLVWTNLVVVNAGQGCAVEKATGKVVWKFEGLPGLATPVAYRADNKDAVLLFGGDKLVARDMLSGKELWSIPWKTNLAVNACDPIFHEGKVHICTGYGLHSAVYDLSISPPKELWKASGSSFSSGFRHEDSVFYFDGGHLSCRDFVSGERHWRGPWSGGGSVLLVDEKLIVLTERGELHIAPLSSEKFDATLKTKVLDATTWTPLTYVDGKLLIRSNKGKVVCLQIGK